MKCLFIDTSKTSLTVALIIDNVIKKREITSINEHSKYAISELKKLLDECNVEPKTIDKIMVINGPGSFTGIRIGVTIAKTYAWSLNKNVIPISTLKAHAISLDENDFYVCAIDAKRNHVYAAIYDKSYNSILEEQYISKDSLLKEISKLNNYTITSDVDFENNNELKLDVKKIYDYFQNDLGVNAHTLKPNYLKKVEAEEKLGSVKSD